MLFELRTSFGIIAKPVPSEVIDEYSRPNLALSAIVFGRRSSWYRIEVCTIAPFTAAQIVVAAEDDSFRTLFARTAKNTFAVTVPRATLRQGIRLEFTLERATSKLRLVDRKVSKAAPPRLLGGRVTISRTLGWLENLKSIADRGRAELSWPAWRADTPLYRRWISEYERPGSWACTPSGPSVSFLVVAHPDAPQAALKRTLASLARLGAATRWDVVTNDTLQRANKSLTVIAEASRDRTSVLEAFLESATGTYVAVLDAGEVVSPHTLREFWSCVQRSPCLDVAYSDEDGITARGERTRPFFKPSWSPDYLADFNYLGRLCFIRRSLAIEVGGFQAPAGKDAEWDLYRRVGVSANRVDRIARVLCHRPTAVGAEEFGLPFSPVPLYSKSKTTNASADLVSIIVSGRHLQGSGPWLQTLVQTTSYDNVEVIIVVNDEPSLAQDVFGREEPSVVRRVTNKGYDRYADRCNAGANAARGTLLLFLGQPMAALEVMWLNELVHLVRTLGVGIATPRLIDCNGRSCGGPLVLGKNELLGSMMDTAEGGRTFGPPEATRNCLVSASACHLIRRAVFEEIGGFDDTFATEASNLAFGLAAHRRGHRTAWAPRATLKILDPAAPKAGEYDDDISRLSGELALFGVVDDPYAHPGLNAAAHGAELRYTPEPTVASTLEVFRSNQLWQRPDTTSFNAFDDAELFRMLGPEDLALVLWPHQTAETVNDVKSAKRFVIDLVRRHPETRRQFPHGLSEGANGALARWIVGKEGRQRFGLTETTADLISVVFGSNPAGSVRRAYQLADGIIQSMPFGCLPIGLRDLFVWLVQDGMTRFSLCVEEIWWFALECLEQPELELVRSFLFNTRWQKAFPDGLTVFSSDRLARWLRATYGVDASWLNPDCWPATLTAAEQIRLAAKERRSWRNRFPDAFASETGTRALVEWLKTADSDISPRARHWLSGLDVAQIAHDLVVTGVNVLGNFCFPSGLRTSTLAISASLTAAKCNIAQRDVWVAPAVPATDRLNFSDPEIYSKTLIHVQPGPELDDIYLRANLQERDLDVYKIGFWYWELEDLPNDWLIYAKKVDELWAPSRFIGDAMRRRLNHLVFDVNPGFELPRFNYTPPKNFDVSVTSFTFLFVFSFMSVVERKNPLGLIKAFHLAFGEDPNVSLVLKTSFGAQHLDALNAIRNAAGSNVRILDIVLTQDETLSLMASCDCYVSLHRSEGLGLTLAEAMLLQKPVIATGYSGNVDFMDEGNSLLVDYRLVELTKDYGPYTRGAVWAEPSLEHAAQCMRRVNENRKWAADLGRRAEADLSKRLSHAKAGELMASRLAMIDDMLRERLKTRPI